MHDEYQPDPPLWTPPAPRDIGPADEDQDAGRYHAATLWLPDPESWSGWSIRQVPKQKPTPKRRPLGLRKR